MSIPNKSSPTVSCLWQCSIWKKLVQKPFLSYIQTLFPCIYASHMFPPFLPSVRLSFKHRDVALLGRYLQTKNGFG